MCHEVESKDFGSTVLTVTYSQPGLVHMELWRSLRRRHHAPASTERKHMSKSSAGVQNPG